MRYKYLQQGGQMDSLQVLNQVVSIIETAGKEIQEGEVGKGTQALVLLLQDKLGSELVAQVVEQAPEFGQIVEAVAQAMLQPQSAEKGAILEAANGCKTCRNYKLLMRRGGKVVEMLVDCNGRPVIKAKKGCKVRKGQLGLSDGIVNEKYTKAYSPETPAPAEGAESSIFYDANAKKLRQNIYADGKWSVQDFATTPMKIGTKIAEGVDSPKTYVYFDPLTGRLMQLSYDVNKGWQGAVNYTDLPEDFYAKGYNPETGIFDSPENAIAAMKQEKYDSYNIAAPTWGPAIGTPGNTAIGTGRFVTPQQAIDQLGYKGALLTNADLLKIHKRSAIKDANAAILNSYRADEDKMKQELGNSYVEGKGSALHLFREQKRQERRDAKKLYKQQYTSNLYNLAGNSPHALRLKAANSSLAIPSNVAASAPAPDASNYLLKEEKQGGWLNKYNSPKAKCGKKIKKAKCGKKLQEGDKIKKASAGRSCQLKRVGGKLIEVDSCTGMPIHRDGGVMKFQPGGWFKNPFSSWEEFLRLFGAPVDALVRGAKKVYQWMQNDPNNPENRKAVLPLASQESTPKVLTQDEVAKQREESRKGVEALLKQRLKKVQKLFDLIPSEDVPSVLADVQDKFDLLKLSNPPQKETFVLWIQKNINKPGGEDWSSYNNRVILANKYGINDYKGTAQQNMLLWDRLKHEVNAGINPTAVQPLRIAAPTIGIVVPKIGITTK